MRGWRDPDGELQLFNRASPVAQSPGQLCREASASLEPIPRPRCHAGQCRHVRPLHGHDLQRTFYNVRRAWAAGRWTASDNGELWVWCMAGRATPSARADADAGDEGQLYDKSQKRVGVAETMSVVSEGVRKVRSAIRCFRCDAPSAAGLGDAWSGRCGLANLILHNTVINTAECSTPIGCGDRSTRGERRSTFSAIPSQPRPARLVCPRNLYQLVCCIVHHWPGTSWPTHYCSHSVIAKPSLPYDAAILSPSV